MCDAWAEGGLPEILYAKSRSCVSDATDSAAARAPWGLAKQKKKTEDPGRSSPLHSRSHREIFQSMETTLRFSGCNILVQEYSKPALPKAQQKAI